MAEGTETSVKIDFILKAGHGKQASLYFLLGAAAPESCSSYLGTATASL